MVMTYMAACSPVDNLATMTPTRGISPSPFTPLIATATPVPPTTIPAIEATQTSTPTEIPPTSTREPFLPAGLARIDANNIAQLEWIASLPVSEIYNLAFSPSGTKLATLSEPWGDRFNDYMEVWDLAYGEQILLVEKWDSPWGLFFSPDEKNLYADNREYDLAQGAAVNTFKALPAAFSPNGLTYATGDYQGPTDESKIEIIDLTTNMGMYKLVNPGMVMFLDFSPDGRLLTGGFQVVNNFHLKVWDITSGTELTDLIDFYSRLIFTPDSTLTATVKNDQIYLFDTAKMTYLTSYGFSDPYAHPYTKDFSANGDILAIEDRYSIKLLVPETGRELLSLPEECELKFSPDGCILVTWCYQTDLKIWGVKSK
jgi:WD40 repeat protein